jgi:hypothetical protein
MRRSHRLLVPALLLFAGCSLPETGEPGTTEATVEVSPEGTVETSTTVETTTTLETTTTTTVPPSQVGCIATLKCQFAKLAGEDLSFLKLEFTDFSVADMTGTKLAKANLKQAVMIRTNLTEADLTGANLTGADLTGAVVAGATFTDAVMTNAVICGIDTATFAGFSEKQLAEVQRFGDKKRLCP